MLRFIAARLAYAIPTLLAISFLVFFAGYLSPADPVDIILGQHASPEAKARLRHEWGLDRPPLVRYGDYVYSIVTRGDFGRSFTRNNESVRDIIGRGFPHTALLAVTALLLSLLVGIPLGIFAAVRANSVLDRLSVGAALAGVALPSFVLGPLLVILVALPPRQWLPPAGWGGPEYLILPAVVLAARSSALIARLTRSSMLETLRQDYIRTARAKGLGEGAVLFRHALKNAFPPMLTAAGTTFGYLLSGSFVVETFFNVPGIGYESIGAIMRRDYPVVQGLAILLAAIFVCVNLIVDILYGVLDPRARVYGVRARRSPTGDLP